MISINKNTFVLWCTLCAIILFSIPGKVTCAINVPENDTVFAPFKQELVQQGAKIASLRFNEKLADSLSNQLAERFKEILELEGAFEYAFDSIFPIGKVESNDGKLRIFTWNIVLNNGTYKYFGLLQYREKTKEPIKVFILNDASETIESPENASLTAENWFGALYYEIVESKLPETTLYTVMGWDGNSLYTCKKVIESLTFSSSGKPKFGKMVFKDGRVKQKRVIFEYSRMANMMLSYDTDTDMIVFDHLSPSSPIYEGNVAYYGPDFSFDGYEFKDEVWNLVSDVNYKSTPANTINKKSKKR